MSPEVGPSRNGYTEGVVRGISRSRQNRGEEKRD